MVIVKPVLELKLPIGVERVAYVSVNELQPFDALDLLLDESVGIVSLGGKAGTGKSALALCAGLEAVLERRTQRKVVVFRPLYAVGGQDLGYLPGSESDKMGPWAQAVFDTLEGLASKHVMDEVLGRGLTRDTRDSYLRPTSGSVSWAMPGSGSSDDSDE